MQLFHESVEPGNPRSKVEQASQAYSKIQAAGVDHSETHAVKDRRGRWGTCAGNASDDGVLGSARALVSES